MSKKTEIFIVAGILTLLIGCVQQNSEAPQETNEQVPGKPPAEGYAPPSEKGKVKVHVHGKLKGPESELEDVEILVRPWRVVIGDQENLEIKLHDPKDLVATMDVNDQDKQVGEFVLPSGVKDNSGETITFENLPQPVNWDQWRKYNIVLELNEGQGTVIVDPDFKIGPPGVSGPPQTGGEY